MGADREYGTLVATMRYPDPTASTAGRMAPGALLHRLLDLPVLLTSPGGL